MDQQERRHLVANQYIAALSSPNEETLTAIAPALADDVRAAGMFGSGQGRDAVPRLPVLLRTHFSRPLSGTLPRSTVMSHRCALDNKTPFVVAYVDAAGVPHVSPRGTVQSWSPDQVAMWARDPAGGLPRAIRRPGSRTRSPVGRG